jgi:hypothetical protein
LVLISSFMARPEGFSSKLLYDFNRTYSIER